MIPIVGRQQGAGLVRGAQEDLPAHGAAACSRAGAGRWCSLTQLVFYGLPWLEWDGRQAVLFDLGARRFYIFGLVLYPQDFIYLTGLLVVCGAARCSSSPRWPAGCGAAIACPQTVYTEIFLWVEHRFEGDRTARMRLDASAVVAATSWSRKGGKHVAVARASRCGPASPSSATSRRSASWRLSVLRLRFGPWEGFWVFFYGFATYGNAGFMREQVCKYMCPYARFQSAMFDRDTLIVTYDTERGEPRGARPARQPTCARSGLGDCIDCTLCVQVCPTGIDIRKGLQYECIGCAACVDACDGVMDKMGYPRGLIRYATQNGMDGHWTPRQMLRRVLRPRVLVYGARCWRCCASVSLASLAMRTPLKVDVVRDRGALARIVEGGRLENVYRLQIMNATEQPQRYRIEARGLEGLSRVAGRAGRGRLRAVALGRGAAAAALWQRRGRLPHRAFRRALGRRRRAGFRESHLHGASMNSEGDAMNDQATTSPPWWRFPLLWMVIAGPALVVVASFVTLWLALHTPDPVLTPDYYRKGIEINKTLADKKLMPALAGRNHAATPDADLPAPKR